MATDHKDTNGINLHEGKEQPLGHVTVNRPVYTKAAFQDKFGYTPDETPVKERIISTFKKSCTCSGECLKKTALGLVPCINMLKNYQWKAWTLSDLVAGISVGLIHIPQSMGFALLTSVPPVYGLYASFFPIILYFLFGTSNHISVGTMAVISLMVGAVVDRETAGFVPSNQTNLVDAVMSGGNDTVTGGGEEDQELIMAKVGVAAAVTFWVGIIQILMGVLRLGVVTTFMPMPFVNGFITGSACHIATSQIKFLLGLKLKRFDGILLLIYTWIEIFKNIAKTNVAELIIGIICIAILVFVKEWVNVKFKDKLPVPIPAELIVVALGAVVSYTAKLDEKFGVKIIKDIPRGFPTPTVPALENSGSYIVDAFVTAIVSFAISISLAKIYCKKYKYEVQTNQELLAYGISHSISAFFGAFAGAAAPPRCTVHDSTGGKTQIASLWSALLVLLAFLALGMLFEPLPNSALASIILVALIPMFKQFSQLPELWRVNKYDFTIWLGTLLAVVILDVSTGLGVGIGISLLTLPIQAWLSSGHVKGRIDETDLYAPMALYKSSTQLAGVRIFNWESNLVFVNVDRFKAQLFKAVGSPAQCNEDKVQCVVVDCCGMSYVDFMGLGLIKTLGGDYNEVGVDFALCGCGQSLMDRLEAGSIDGKGHHVKIYPTTSDAVAATHHLHQGIHGHKDENSATQNGGQDALTETHDENQNQNETTSI